MTPRNSEQTGGPHDCLQVGVDQEGAVTRPPSVVTATSDLGDSVGLASPRSDDELSLCSSGVNMTPFPSDHEYTLHSVPHQYPFAGQPIFWLPPLQQPPFLLKYAARFPVENILPQVLTPTLASQPAVPLQTDLQQVQPKCDEMRWEGERQAVVSMCPDQNVLFAHSPVTTSTPPVTSTSEYPSSVTLKMEIVWHSEFSRNFSSFSLHVWQLQPTAAAPTDGLAWRTFKDSAKVRFHCDRCGNGWTSMKGRVMFWIYLDAADCLGGVLFKLYGQACQKCCKNESPNFCHAMWYPEEVIKVIGNLYNRVGQLFYGFSRPPLRIDRRQGKPRERHCSLFCQACQEGVCKFEWTFN